MLQNTLVISPNINGRQGRKASLADNLLKKNVLLVKVPISNCFQLNVKAGIQRINVFH